MNILATIFAVSGCATLMFGLVQWIEQMDQESRKNSRHMRPRST